MNPNPTPQFHAFTTEFNWIVNVLKTDILIRKWLIWEGEGMPIIGIRDTWATQSVISSELVDRLWLQPISFIQVNYAWGSEVRPVYLVDVLLPNKVSFEGVKVTACVLAGWDMLVGMDIIWSWDFAVTKRNNKTVMSFIYPSRWETIDFVADIRRSNSLALQSINSIPSHSNQKKSRKNNRSKMQKQSKKKNRKK